MSTIQKNIASALELEKLPPEEQKEMILRVGTLIYQNVLMRVVGTMTKKDQDEFEKLLDRNANPEDVFVFLKEKNKDFEKIIDEEAIKFKNRATSIMDQIGD